MGGVLIIIPMMRIRRTLSFFSVSSVWSKICGHFKSGRIQTHTRGISWYEPPFFTSIQSTSYLQSASEQLAL